MAEKTMHQAIRWFIVVVLIISLFIQTGQWLNYGVTLALIYLILRVPMQYAK